MALNSLFCADVPLSNYSLTDVPPDCKHWENVRLKEFIGRAEILNSFVVGCNVIICTVVAGRLFVLRLRNDLYCVEWGVKLYSLTRRTFVGYLNC